MSCFVLVVGLPTMSTLRTLCTLLLVQGTLSDTTVYIHNEFLSQGGRVQYEVDRWNKHNGLTNNNLIPKCKSIGTEPGRWLNRDLNGHLFANWPQSSSHHGYPDPSYLKDQTLQRNIWGKYLDDIRGYGHEIKMVWNLKGLSWPNWIDTSHHPGHFPNNIDAAAEFVSLMVQGLHDYNKGHMPPFLEVINEPFAKWGLLDQKTVLDFHRSVAQKLKSRFQIKVGGPTYTDYYVRHTNGNNFNEWKRTTQFLDLTLDHMDFFSFHAYNNIYVTGNTHHWTGINEARLVAFVDMVENYAHIKKGRNVPLIISEFGRGAVHGISESAPSGIVSFATVYQASAHMFTYLNLREFMEMAIVFLLSNENYPGNMDSLNWSLFSRDGHATKNANHFKFWQHLGYDHKFLKVTSQFTGHERTVSPLALSNPKTKELVVLLVNYGTSWQNVHLEFKDGWIKPTAGQSTCLVYQNGNAEMHSNVHFDTTKNNGKVGLAGEAICMYKFKTNFNFGSLHTTNENTYYGKDMIIPISNRHAQTTVSLPSSGYHTARMRIGVSLDDKSQNGKPLSVMFNDYKLPSNYNLYDSDRDDAKTKWEVWEFWVPHDRLKSTNTVSMTFAGSGGHVSSVALIVGKLQ